MGRASFLLSAESRWLHWGCLYGLYYAVLVEHQMLDQMGGALATAFVNAAGEICGRPMPRWVPIAR